MVYKIVVSLNLQIKKYSFFKEVKKYAQLTNTNYKSKSSPFYLKYFITDDLK